MQPESDRSGVYRQAPASGSGVDGMPLTAQRPPAGPSASRHAAVDVARGLAVLLMIQTHAFDGWVHPLHKHDLGYGLTRVLACIPAPLFLLLAGIGLSLGAQSARGRGQTRKQTRWGLARRGLGIVAWGYGVSLLYALIESSRPVSFQAVQILRADILHCIGLSLSLCALVLVGRQRVWAWTLALLIVSIVAALLIPRVLPTPTQVWAAAAWGLWFDVPGYSRFPVFPLLGFCAIGFCVGEALRVRSLQPQEMRRAFVACVLGAGLAWLATRGLLWAIGGSLNRQHPAVIANLVDGTLRAMAVLCLAQLLAHRLPARSFVLRVLLHLGGASLFVYALHIPLCYGRLSSPIAHSLSVAAALPLVILLMALCWAVLFVRDALRRVLPWRKPSRTARAPS